MAELGKPLAAWTIHDVRRSAATASSEHGADRYLVGLLLNHTDASVTATYDRSPRLDEKRKILRFWNDGEINSQRLKIRAPLQTSWRSNVLLSDP
jgi:integrase